jgi:dTDP-4-amino-4,6-dideoxygalactose transaminase
LPQGRSAWHIFPIFTPKRNELLDYLKARGIGTGIHYPIPVHLQRGYRHLGYKRGDFPLTEQACDEELSLPMYAELPLSHLKEVVAAIQDFTTAEAELSVEASRAQS